MADYYEDEEDDIGQQIEEAIKSEFDDSSKLKLIGLYHYYMKIDVSDQTYEDDIQKISNKYFNKNQQLAKKQWTVCPKKQTCPRFPFTYKIYFLLRRKLSK